MPIRIAKIILSFILIMTVSLSGVSVCASDTQSSLVTEIDVIINPKSFDALLKEENRKKEYAVLASINNSNYESVAINTRGSSTFENALIFETKRLPFEITFKNHSKQYDKNHSLKLNNSFSLYNLIAEYLAMKIYEHMHVPVSEVSPVFLSFNGVDFGLYLGIEDVNKKFITRRFGAAALAGGNLYRPVELSRIDDEKIEDTFSTDWFDPLYCKAGNQDHDVLIAFLDALDNGGDDFEQYLDMDEVLRFFACTAAFGGADTLISSSHNFYLYENNGKFILIPWDLSFAFDCFDDDYRIVPDDETLATSKFFNLIMSDEKNLNKYYQYLEEIRETFLKPEIINPIIDEFIASVEDYYKRDRSVVFDPAIGLRYITDGNYLANGNIHLAVNEIYRQIGEQISGESDFFYVPDSVNANLLWSFTEDELRSDNSADVLTDIKDNYQEVYLKSFVDPIGIIIIFVFAVTLTVLFLFYRIPKGRKRNKT